MSVNARSQLASMTFKPSPASGKKIDEALRAMLAHVNLVGCPIGSLTQDKPLPGRYLDTTLTASPFPEAHLQWTKE